MDSTGLKSLHKATNFCFRRKASVFRPFNLGLRFWANRAMCNPNQFGFCVVFSDGEAEIRQESTLPRGTGEAVNEASRSKILQVVLVSPQIPGNTGDIARTCAASAVGLHLVGDFSYRKGDYLLFGSETGGLPPEALQDCNSEPYDGGTIRIPIVET